MNAKTILSAAALAAAFVTGAAQAAPPATRPVKPMVTATA